VRQRLAYGHDAVRVTDDREVGLLHVDRHEERQALDVIPVVVREEQRERQWLSFSQELIAEAP
jgi:hypothetical protein